MLSSINTTSAAWPVNVLRFRSRAIVYHPVYGATFCAYPVPSGREAILCGALALANETELGIATIFIDSEKPKCPSSPSAVRCIRHFTMPFPETE